MKYSLSKAPRPTKLPEIKPNNFNTISSPTKEQKYSKPSPNLSSSRISRQSSSIDTNFSETMKRQASQTRKSNQNTKNISLYNHRAQMNDYLRKTGMGIQTKIFTYNSQDEHIKRCLQKHGWIENHSGSTMFDLKWVYTENYEEIGQLLDGQFYNHFKNTKELTNKQCLLVNFKNQSEYGMDTTNFFPRAFDLGNAQDREEFLKDYEKTCVYIILKRCIQIIKDKRNLRYKQIKLEIMKYQIKKREIKQIRNKKIELKKMINKKYKNIYTSMQLVDDNQQKDFKFDLQILSEVLMRLSDYKRTIEYGYFDDKNFELSQQYIFKIRQKFQQYSQNVLSLQNGQTPNEFLIKKLISYHLFFKENESFYQSDGINNLWIIKPSGCARGQGIYLEKDIGEALVSGMQMQARLIQKYIEKPLLYQKQKFDLRQWVLVRTFQPLQAYVFSHCYMRMCSLPYDLNDTKNLLKHLTNFSLNKQNFTNLKDSIYSSDHLEKWLKLKGVDWQQDIRPQINQIILKTLKIVQEQFENESKYCFELFGFDIMLDNKYKPWLLEVNLSPACTERSEWLPKMLDSMSESMFSIVFGDDFMQNDSYKYELLVDEDQGNNNQINTDANLEIWGTKCNIRKEKVIDKFVIQNFSALIIQKFYRMFQAKKLLKYLRDTKYSIVLQKYIRRKLAIKQRIFLKQTKFALIIQCQIRRKLAQNLRKELKLNKMATRIQCCIRIYLSQKMKLRLQEELAALFVQQLINQKIGFKMALKQFQKLRKIRLIQRHWKQYYKKLNNKGIIIQKNYRSHLQQQIYKKLKEKHQSSICITKNYKRYKAKQLLIQLKQEYSALIIQQLIKIKFSQRRVKLMNVQEGLQKIDKVFNKYKSKLTYVNIYNIGIIRDKAIEKIQNYRLVIKSKRYLKRLKRLKKFIKLQATVRMFLCRCKYLKITKRKKAIYKIMKAIRNYMFRKRINRRANLRRLKAIQPKFSQYQQNNNNKNNNNNNNKIRKLQVKKK